MSVLIKTMTNLPEHCFECPCHDGESGYCQADKEHRYSDYRPFWCPLVYEKSDVLDKIQTKLYAYTELHEDGDYYLREELIGEIFDKYKSESEDKYE